MNTLSKTEERLMQIIWEYERVFMKDLLRLLPEPKPAKTTVATMLKRMYKKGFIDFQTFGNSRQYYPKVKKEDYFLDHLSGMVEKFFGDSKLKFASFYARSNDLSLEELQALKKIVDEEMQKKK